MNYEFLKQKMDKLFSQTPSENFVGKYEAKGYQFIDVKYAYNTTPDQGYNIIITECVQVIKKSRWRLGLFNHQKNIITTPAKVGVFLCNLVPC